MDGLIDRSIDFWLSSIIDADGRRLFGEFMRGEFSEENLEFWLACEQYQAVDDDDQLANMAKQIYEDFVAPNAPREVPLS